MIQGWIGTVKSETKSSSWLQKISILYVQRFLSVQVCRKSFFYGISYDCGLNSAPEGKKPLKISM